MALDQTIVSNALPRIASVFNALDEIAWIPTAFLLTQAPFLLVFGQLNTLFTPKWTFLTSVFFFELGSLLSGVATSVIFLIIARAIQGIGAAGIFVGSLSMTVDIIPLKDRPKFFGLFGGLFAISGILGPLIGGAFVDHVSWRWCFYINLPLAVPTVWFCTQFLHARAPLAMRLTPPAPRAPSESAVTYHTTRFFSKLRKLDWIACILSLGSTICLVLALQWGGVEKPWSSAPVVATLCVCAVTLVLFIVWEMYMGDAALVPLKLFKNRSQVGASLAGLFTRMAFFAAVYYLPLFFQAGKNHSPTKSGIDMMPITLALVFTSAISGTLVSKFGRYWHFLVFGPFVGAVGYGLVFTMDEHASWGKIIGIQILMGIGIGCTLQTTMLAVQADNEKHMIPQATSILTYAQFLGGIFALAIAGGIFKSKLVSGLAEFAPGAPVELLRKSVEALGHLPADQHTGAVHAYVKAVQWSLAPLGIAASVFTSISALMIRNLSVRKEEDRPGSGQRTPPGERDVEAQPEQTEAEKKN
ncbi:MFS general substrate transporter [Auricularia subglabra TFB-10046 SS5]|nr:MFS general substrate transporter [Auricularia subglabra TFB-10046 SS5]